MKTSPLVTALATSILAGLAIEDEMVKRCNQTLGRDWQWVRSLTRRYLENFSQKVRPRHQAVVKFLQLDEGFRSARKKYAQELLIADWLPSPQKMQPIAAAEAWNIPVIESAKALADWLSIDYEDLQWFADLKGLESKGSNARLKNYRYRVLAKEFGSIRLVEAPKARLKGIQRQVLVKILNYIPVHDLAHGFVRGRSIKSFAAPHVERHVVIRMDLQDFFPSISGVRVQALFRTAGYPESVADLLGGICTNAAPRQIWKEFGSEFGVKIDSQKLREARSLYARPHLPQGAPTSPALANLCAYRADCRLSGLARSSGARYTRYADDLAFSGPASFGRGAESFAIHAAAILLEEGFAVHHRKTRIMRRGVRQYLAGTVVNERVNVVRTDFDRLKATLNNCLRHGAEGQNRAQHPSFKMHLEGRVSFVEMINPAKGARLRRIFNLIQW